MNNDWLWWKDGVIYQIYPRSFYDSNRDGIGDINGLIQKLDYLQFLGVDAVWLSPINASPMDDFGYDVKSYRNIHNIFGKDEDFDDLIAKAHRRNIRIVFDLVINHTSDTHLWFLESRSSLKSRKRDWYIWHKGRNGREPNNWLAAFGGSAWEYDSHTNEYYLHSFLKGQPDLNWRNPEVVRAVFEEIRHWLDKGIDGFRLDVANYYVKDDAFRNNPYGWGWPPQKYFLQKHIFDRNRPENHTIMKQLRTLLDTYDERMAVGEIFAMPPLDQRLPASYYGNGRDELHLAFDFSFMYTRWSARRFYKILKKWYSLLPDGGWPCIVFSNHDQPRSITRFSRYFNSVHKARLLAFFMMTVKGTPFLYYGEEIGMRNARLAPQNLQDPAGKRYWPFFAGRDPARTPMQWNDRRFAGFSEVFPWLPVDSSCKTVNVEAQKDDPASLLNIYRTLIHLRREFSALRTGEIRFLKKGKREILSYERKSDSHIILVLLNFSWRRKYLLLHKYRDFRVLFSTHLRADMFLHRIMYVMKPYEATILIKSVE
ncbi:MAG: glycoside hydrolase family 13 protein [Spirochaetota bacterium]